MIYIPTPEELKQLAEGKHPLQLAWDKKKPDGDLVQ